MLDVDLQMLQLHRQRLPVRLGEGEDLNVVTSWSSAQHFVAGTGSGNWYLSTTFPYVPLAIALSLKTNTESDPCWGWLGLGPRLLALPRTLKNSRIARWRNPLDYSMDTSSLLSHVP